MHCDLRLAALAAVAATGASALENGLARTPPMGFNSWTAFGSGVTAEALIGVARFFKSSGLLDAG
jgi:alpha-galactosidase